MPEIVAYIGVIGSGKDFSANKLVTEKGYVRLYFKDALLDMASDLAGYDVRADYDFFKEHIVGVRRSENPFKLSFARSDCVDMQNEHPDLMTGRRLLQRLGTEVMRKRDPDYWAEAFTASARKILKSDKSIVCADCRFKNEVDAIRGIVGYKFFTARFIFCDYKSGRYDPASKHASEKMAQTLLALGLKDQEPIEDGHFWDIKA